MSEVLVLSFVLKFLLPILNAWCRNPIWELLNLRMNAWSLKLSLQGMTIDYIRDIEKELDYAMITSAYDIYIYRMRTLQDQSLIYIDHCLISKHELSSDYWIFLNIPYNWNYVDYCKIHFRYILCNWKSIHKFFILKTIFYIIYNIFNIFNSLTFHKI